MKGIDNYFLPSDNLKKAKEFYEKIGLHLKFDFSDMGMIAFNAGNDEPAIILKDVKKFKEAKPAVWFAVDNVALEYKKMKDKGINFLSEPFNIKTGMAVEFNDPFGNKLGITDYTNSKRGE